VRLADIVHGRDQRLFGLGLSRRRLTRWREEKGEEQQKRAACGADAGRGPHQAGKDADFRREAQLYKNLLLAG
jgi:hypothetical protein